MSDWNGEPEEVDEGQAAVSHGRNSVVTGQLNGVVSNTGQKVLSQRGSFKNHF